MRTGMRLGSSIAIAGILAVAAPRGTAVEVRAGDADTTRPAPADAAARPSGAEGWVERLQESWSSGAFWAGRPRLGLDVVDMDADLGRYFAAPRDECVLVTRVHPDGPAARAGVRAGDLVLALDGRPARGVSGLQGLVAERADAAHVRLEIWRRDRRLEITVALAAPAAPRVRAPARADGPGAAEMEDLRRALRNLEREIDDLRREVDLLRRRR